MQALHGPRKLRYVCPSNIGPLLKSRAHAGVMNKAVTLAGDFVLEGPVSSGSDDIIETGGSDELAEISSLAEITSLAGEESPDRYKATTPPRKAHVAHAPQRVVKPVSLIPSHALKGYLSSDNVDGRVFGISLKNGKRILK